MNWTPEHDAELVRMLEAGRSARQIAEALGTSRCAVLGRKHRIGLAKRTTGWVDRPVKDFVPVQLPMEPEPEPPNAQRRYGANRSMRNYQRQHHADDFTFITD